MATGGNEHFYINKSGNVLVGYVESLRGSYGALFKGQVSSNGNFTGYITSESGCSISRKGVQRLRFKIRNAKLHLRTLSGQPLVLSKRTRVNSSTMKYNRTFFPRNRTDVAGYWERAAHPSNEVLFIQHLNGDSIIGIKSTGYEQGATSFNTTILYGRLTSGRAVSNPSVSSSMRLTEIPIAKGNGAKFRSYNGKNSAVVSYSLGSTPPVRYQSARLTERGARNWERKSLDRKIYIDLISIKQISKDACNEKLDYMGSVKRSNTLSWLWKHEKSNKIRGLKESPGVNKFVGTAHRGSGQPRVFSTTTYDLKIFNQRMTNSHYAVVLIDDDDMACGGSDDKIDINPESNKTDLPFYVDYFGNIQRISGDRSLNNPRQWNRLLTRIGKVDQVITSRGTERGNNKEIAQLQFRVRVK